MDAEKLPEVGSNRRHTSGPGAARRVSPLWRVQACSEIIDLLLSVPGAVQGHHVDVLLDLRFLVRHRRDAEATLRLFCELRRHLEQKHYLELYRLRRWLEGNMRVEITPTPGCAAIIVPLRLDFFCVEAIRRHCLCGALDSLPADAKPCLQFAFGPEVSV